MVLIPGVPRVVTAALRGGAGKTLITVGLVAALRRRGLSPAVFKKGPDYIDAGWLGLAAGTDCYNLDSFLCDPAVVLDSFARRSRGKSFALVEGNRGLFDGVDSRGSYSTAELAKLLSAPVVLIVDATKTTRTAAAMVLGCRILDPVLDVAGIIFNRVGTLRQESVLREAVEAASGIPVIGAVRKLALENFPQRHLGLLPLHEHPGAMEFVAQAAKVAEDSIDLDRLLEIADRDRDGQATRRFQRSNSVLAAAPLGDEARSSTRNGESAPLAFPARKPATRFNGEATAPAERVGNSAAHASDPRDGQKGTARYPSRGPAENDDLRIGILDDAAFQFYYPENLEAVTRFGARLVRINSMEPRVLPELDALYVGGGFPETNAERLAANSVFKDSLLAAVKMGLPVYAECGGLMYLSRNLCMDENTYPMTGVFDVDTVMQRRPQGLGYIRVEAAEPNPFYPQGTILTGHEFHYSTIVGIEGSSVRCAFRVLRGHGIDGIRDGICAYNALGTYLHIHALGEPAWAEGILRRAAEYRTLRRHPGPGKVRQFQE